MKTKILILFLFFFTHFSQTYAQDFEEIICWGITEYNAENNGNNGGNSSNNARNNGNNAENGDNNSADAIIIFYHGSTLKLLVMNSESEKLIYDMDIKKLYLDQTIAKDTSYIGVRGPITLIEKKNQKHEEGHIYLNCSNNTKNPDIVKFDFASYKKSYLCKPVKAEMRNDLVALAVIGTSTSFSEEEYERRVNEATNQSK